LTSPPIVSSSPGTSSSMKQTSPLLSAMVLAFWRTLSFLMLLMLCPLLLDRCTSFCQQEHHPAPLTSPAPLPVPLRLCLGCPRRLRWLLLIPQRTLLIPRRQRSTSHLRCGRQGPFPRHAQHRTRPARLEALHLASCTSRQRFTRARSLQHRPRAPQRRCHLRPPPGPRPGSRLFVQTAPSPTTTRAGLDHSLLQLHLHQPRRSHCPKVLLLSLL